MMLGFPTKRMTLHVTRQPLVLAGLAMLALSSLALGVVVIAVWHPAAALLTETEARNTALLAELKELKHRQDMADLYRTRTAQAEALEKKLQLARSEPEFIAEVEKLSAATRADLLQFSSRAAPKDKAATETTIFEFSLKGDYASVKAFLAGVRELPEFVTIERVVLERAEPVLRARIIVKRRQARKV
ncbi:MAG: type 4a pilus biogenesis protein PilO [Hyphomicrobiaceae bacterium]|nr:type 4a pilus biogenesis protein PilO [Hyphomicrobiaceae bacterium]